MNEVPLKYQVIIARGNIYIPLATYDAYLKNIEAVALLPHDEGILLFPLIQDSAGGLLLTTRNLNGDRLVHAQEFFRNNGYAEKFIEKPSFVSWLTDRAALLIRDVDRVIGW